MPHNEPCPVCGLLVPDWHWEWHSDLDFREIYRGAAGMECPLCGAVVTHVSATLPLLRADASVKSVRRDVNKASLWSRLSTCGAPLEEYLTTESGRHYASLWTQAEVRQADQQTAGNP
jgi:hypothetical protein